MQNSGQNRYTEREKFGSWIKTICASVMFLSCPIIDLTIQFWGCENYFTCT